MKLTRYEQETIINFNEEEKSASVYTHNRPLIRKLEKLAKERPGEVRLVKVSHLGQAVEYYVPKSWLRINPPRQLSEEQRAKLYESSKGTRFAQNNGAVHPVQTNDTAAEGNYIAQLSDI